MVQPRITVALGSVAGEAIFGRGFRVRDHRGRLEEATVGEWQGPVLTTVHPSSILRTEDADAREEAFAGFVADLVKAREALAA